MSGADRSRAAGPGAEQLVRLRQEIEAVEAELAEREAELMDLKVELSAFRLEYDTRVGRKVEELERAEEELARCRRRVEQYRQWGAGGLPRTRGGASFVPVEEQYRRTWQQPPEPPPRVRSWLDLARRVPLAQSATEERVKHLYRQLCRRFHPDLAGDPSEKARRTEIMAAINAAYAGRLCDVQQSLAELEALAETADYDRWEESGTGEQRVVALRERLRRLEQQLRQVRQEIRELTDSPAVRMSLEVKLAERRGRDLLAEMEAQVKEELVRKRAELDFLLAQLRQLGIPP